eukprot:TRINITY_DN19680_c3_g2_i1.p1 TRINITY_DN19680_c3_g2~~TRINITY_DN19680_c3_g2_i1.p1  ORF type:complete len:264 (+),score=61.42 TRINITY_DN19680_c3_g2_i1:74-793(+)
MGGGASRARPRQGPAPAREAWDVAPGDSGPPQRADAVKVAVLGLDDAGKTAVAELARHGERRYRGPSRAAPHVPWARYSGVAVEGCAAPLDLWVASGFAPMRKHWPDVLSGAAGLIFVFDAEDPVRAPLAWSELRSLTVDAAAAEPSAANMALLVLVARSSPPQQRSGCPALTAASLRDGTRDLAPPAVRDTHWAIYDVDLAEPEGRTGLQPALAWLAARARPPAAAPAPAPVAAASDT